MREGPLVTVHRSCDGCVWEHSEGYRVQGDSGHNVYCTHPSNAIAGEKPTRRYIADTLWDTPEWCPFVQAEGLARRDGK